MNLKDIFRSLVWRNVGSSSLWLRIGTSTRAVVLVSWIDGSTAVAVLCEIAVQL